MAKPVIAAKDSELARRCREGDQEAMKTLYGLHAPRLFTLAMRLTGNQADAEEIVQDCFIRAWRKMGSFRGEASIGTWLYRITLNLSRDQLKKRKNTTSEVEIAYTPTLPDAFAQKNLEKALGKLSEGYREVLVMHDVMGMKHPQIAQVLGVAVGTSKSQLHKARAQMRQLLKKSNIARAV